MGYAGADVASCADDHYGGLGGHSGVIGGVGGLIGWDICAYGWVRRCARLADV